MLETSLAIVLAVAASRRVVLDRIQVLYPFQANHFPPYTHELDDLVLFICPRNDMQSVLAPTTFNITERNGCNGVSCKSISLPGCALRRLDINSRAPTPTPAREPVSWSHNNIDLMLIHHPVYSFRSSPIFPDLQILRSLLGTH